MKEREFNKIVNELITMWDQGSYKKARRRLTRYVVSNTTGNNPSNNALLAIIKLKWELKEKISEVIVSQVMDQLGGNHRDKTKLRDVDLDRVVGLHKDSQFVFRQIIDDGNPLPPAVTMKSYLVSQVMHHHQKLHDRVYSGLTAIEDWENTPYVSPKVYLGDGEIVKYKRYLIKVFGEVSGKKLGEYSKLAQFIITDAGLTTWWSRDSFVYDRDDDDYADLDEKLRQVHRKLMYLGTGQPFKHDDVWDVDSWDDDDDWDNYDVSPITSTEWA